MGKRELTGGPGLSAGEREGGKGGGGGWAGPRRGAGEGEMLGLQAEKGKGKEKFLFFSNNFSMHFPNGFLISLTFVFKTLIT